MADGSPGLRESMAGEASNNFNYSGRESCHQSSKGVPGPHEINEINQATGSLLNLANLTPLALYKLPPATLCVTLP